MGWQSWSTTASDNDDSDAAINWAEGQAPSTVNNSARAMMAGLAAARIMLGGGVTTGGSADAQTLTSGLSLSAYQQGVPLGFEAGFTNTTTTTLNVDGLGAKTVKRPDGSNLLAGDITAGGLYEVGYESGADVLILKNPTPQVLTGQQTIWLPKGAWEARTTNGAASGVMESTTNDVMTPYWAFDSTTSEGIQTAIQMPKGWDEGTIIAQFVWTHPAAVTNFGVRLGIRAVAFANDDALDTAFGTEQEVTDTGGTTSDVYLSPETSAMTVAGTPGAEEYVVFEVYRDPDDAADTLAVDAYLIGVKLHYTTNAAVDN